MRYAPDDCKRRTARSTPILLVLVGLAAIALVPYCLLVLFVPLWRWVEQPIKQPGRVLLVTAHPDDETVFFGPTITALHSSGHEVYLLCLTTGNARGLGQTRVKELRLAAAALKIDYEHLSVQDDQKLLPDSKTADWDLPYAQSLIRTAVQRWQIHTIITFDSGGVTGHKNHMSCWQAVSLDSGLHHVVCTASGICRSKARLLRSFAAECKYDGCPEAWSLRSSGKWGRYSTMVDPGPSGTGTGSQRQTASYLSRNVFRNFMAMAQHRTQWRWWSHVLFTRYTYSNSLQAMNIRKPIVSFS